VLFVLNAVKPTGGMELVVVVSRIIRALVAMLLVKLTDTPMSLLKSLNDALIAVRPVCGGGKPSSIILYRANQ
jgi:hypothetical protein